jgi:hypothetical protein
MLSWENLTISYGVWPAGYTFRLSDGLQEAQKPRIFRIEQSHASVSPPVVDGGKMQT